MIWAKQNPFNIINCPCIQSTFAGAPCFVGSAPLWCFQHSPPSSYTGFSWRLAEKQTQQLKSSPKQTCYYYWVIVSRRGNYERIWEICGRAQFRCAILKHSNLSNVLHLFQGSKNPPDNGAIGGGRTWSDFSGISELVECGIIIWMVGMCRVIIKGVRPLN